MCVAHGVIKIIFSMKFLLFKASHVWLTNISGGGNVSELLELRGTWDNAFTEALCRACQGNIKEQPKIPHPVQGP